MRKKEHPYLKLVRSSLPGEVERDRDITLLTERAVLTRMVCRELADSDIGGYDRRPITALHQLLKWVFDNQRSHVHGEPRADDGLDCMVVPKGLEALFSEIKAGAEVCNALFMLTTADTGLQVNSDRARIKDRLSAYRQEYSGPHPVVLM